MSKQNIVIITGTGGPLGTGHLQRMLTLASEIDFKGEYDFLIITNNEELIPSQFRSRAVTTLPEKCSLIIKDMRDSSESEMMELKKKSPVIAVDDTGKGRSRADYIIDLLPNPVNSLYPQFYKEEFFLYGYNFTREIETAVTKIEEKFIDAVIYTGADPSADSISFIRSILPEKAGAVHLTKNGPSDFFTGNPAYEDLSYGEILAGSKLLITHFGITLFEGFLSGCILFTVNPSDYHRALTDMVRKKMNITDSADLSVKDAKILLQKKIDESSRKVPSHEEAASAIKKGPENFYSFIRSLLN
jgi:hypothetical protein